MFRSGLGSYFAFCITVVCMCSWYEIEHVKSVQSILVKSLHGNVFSL